MLAKFFVAMMYQSKEIYEEAKKLLVRKYGKIERESFVYDFNFTNYYENEMGKGLKKRFAVFEKLMERDKLLEVKLYAMEIEEKLSVDGKRRINIDPGYITKHALILATRKERSHRIYLGNGIFAEVTLTFTKKGCRYFEWTYADYKQEELCEFFQEIRKKLNI